MKIINKVNSDTFGELLAFGDDNGSPLFWGKQVEMKFLSKEERGLIIALDLYCYDEEFNADGWDKQDVDTILDNIYNQYQIFLNDCKELDELFIREFNEGKEEWDIETIIQTSSDLYSKVVVLQVDIVKEAYIISFLLDGDEWALIKRCSSEALSYFYISPRAEAEFAEMDY